MSGTDPSAAVTVTLGRCDEMRAEVFVRVETTGDAPPCAIAGTLTGPQRGRDTTLPATARFQPTATPGVARAILTEPAFWTPDLPNLYRLGATVTVGAAPPRAIDRVVGLRRLGVRGRSLWLDGRRWVPRAVQARDSAAIEACKPAALTALVHDPDEATLARADEIGVAVLAQIPGSRDSVSVDVAERIATWAAHPSAVAAVLPLGMPRAVLEDVAVAAAARKGTLLVAATIAGAQPPAVATPPGIDAFVVALDRGREPHAAWRDGCGLPLIAWRRAAAEPAAGRSPCDGLQASLAAWGGAGGRDPLPWDWAGYIAGAERDPSPP